MNHPAHEEWIAHLAGGRGDELPAPLRQHLRECPGCRSEFDTLRRLRDAGAVGPLASPPDAVVQRVLAGKLEPPVPAPRAEPQLVEAPASDVRGEGAVAASDGLLVARSLPGVQLSIMVVPPGPDGQLRIDGRVWLQTTAEGPMLVVLALGDHVLKAVEATPGARFHIEEVAGPGWTLELQLPDGRTLLLSDPLR